MKIRVLYFASLREKLGRGEELVDLADNSTVADLLAKLEERDDCSEALAQTSTLCIAVDQVFAQQSTALAHGSEVAFFPPVTGG